MNFYLLDESFERIAVIDDYESAIWADRFNTPGDFELYLTIGDKIPSNIKLGRYLYFEDSEHTMVIESIKIEADIEDGNKMIVTGRSLESILDRRIIWNKTVFEKDRFDVVPKDGSAYYYTNPNEEGWYEYRNSQYVKTLDTQVIRGKNYYINTIDLQTAVKRLINENVINPTDSNRKIPNVRFIDSNNQRINTLRLDAEYRGEDLLKTITDICDTNQIGFKLLLDMTDKTMSFRLYNGNDRSYVEGNTGSVIFSAGLDNYLNSSYVDDIKPFKNVTLCEGPEEDTYEKVDKNEEGYWEKNPHEEGWYKWVEGEKEFLPTEDEEPMEGMDYYERDERLKVRVQTVVGSGSGLKRREVYTDGSSLSRQGKTTYDQIPRPYDDDVNPKEEGWYKMIIEHGEEIFVKTEDEEAYDYYDYYSKNTHSRDDHDLKFWLGEEGKKTLKNNKRNQDFYGEVDYNGIFKYGKDFKIGDIVQIFDEYGFTGKARVTEFVWSHNTSDGLKCYPKFEMVEEEE